MVAATKKRVTFQRPGTVRRAVGDALNKQEPGLGGTKTPYGVFYPPTPCPVEKEKTGVKTVLELAAGLSHADKQELLDQLALQNQLTNKAATNPDLDLWAEAVRQALDDTIGAGGGESYGVMLLKRLLGSSACWRPVEKFMVSSKLAGLTKVERTGVYFMLARLLVADAAETCRYTRAPLSAKFVAARTGDLAGVFEQSFPGYLAAGLAPMVAKQMQSEVR